MLFYDAFEDVFTWSKWRSSAYEGIGQSTVSRMAYSGIYVLYPGKVIAIYNVFNTSFFGTRKRVLYISIIMIDP